MFGRKFFLGAALALGLLLIPFAYATHEDNNGKNCCDVSVWFWYCVCVFDTLRPTTLSRGNTIATATAIAAPTKFNTHIYSSNRQDDNKWCRNKCWHNIHSLDCSKFQRPRRLQDTHPMWLNAITLTTIKLS